MNSRFLLIGTVVTAIALFAWQTISNAVLPWHMATMREFANNDAMVEAIRANAPENGVYVSNQGILAAVALTPNLIDKTTLIGQMLGKQFVINLVVAFLLALVALRLRPTTVMGTATALAIAGLAGSALIELSNWNWYGFSASWSIVNLVDHTIQWFIAGLVLAALMRRLAPAAAVGGVYAPAGAAIGGSERPMSKR
jgi:hypothetical protein